MKILVVSPHPDDLEYGCGGTLVKFAKKGHVIHLLYMTAGEAGGDPEVRKSEAAKAAKLIKAKIHWGGFADMGWNDAGGNLQQSSDVAVYQRHLASVSDVVVLRLLGRHRIKLRQFAFNLDRLGHLAQRQLEGLLQLLPGGQ